LNEQFEALEGKDLFDLRSYRKEMKKDGLKVSTHDLWQTVTKKITLWDAQEEVNGSASFGHIFGGY